MVDLIVIFQLFSVKRPRLAPGSYNESNWALLGLTGLRMATMSTAGLDWVMLSLAGLHWTRMSFAH
jgi:hypothetical protein